jgi:predicted MFS family arabinose efflux permease
MSIAGMVMLAATQTPVAVLIGSAVFGAGFGTLQNSTLALMYSRVQGTAYSTVSAIWNAAYDLGMALGAVAVGLVVSAIGFSPAFLLTAAVMVPALFFAHREARSPTARSGRA